MSLTNKRILLGITGGIAAYKSAELVRKLREQGADVQVVMSAAAQEFITPLTLQALSGHAVHTELLDPEAEAGMGHIQLARWADRILVAPATADFMARLSSGEGGDLLTTVCLASKAPLCLAPAMNQAMWAHPATQANLEILQSRGVTLFGPADGEQACGDVGPGRMLEPTTLADLMANEFVGGTLSGKTVLITAGPTREAIDPVRYISNHSSGKMGYALATAAMEAGAEVILVTGPTQLPAPERCEVISVLSASDMLDAVMTHVERCDLFIASAAVADYRPKQLSQQKIKKTGSDTMTLELIKNPDIVATVASLDRRPFTIGFAAETHDVLNYARDKLKRKGLDAIIANDVSDTNIGFNSDDNAVTVITTSTEHTMPLCSKNQLARELVQYFSGFLQEFTSSDNASPPPR